MCVAWENRKRKCVERQWTMAMTMTNERIENDRKWWQRRLREDDDDRMEFRSLIHLHVQHDVRWLTAQHNTATQSNAFIKRRIEIYNTNFHKFASTATLINNLHDRKSLDHFETFNFVRRFSPLIHFDCFDSLFSKCFWHAIATKTFTCIAFKLIVQFHVKFWFCFSCFCHSSFARENWVDIQIECNWFRHLIRIELLLHDIFTWAKPNWPNAGEKKTKRNQ